MKFIFLFIGLVFYTNVMVAQGEFINNSTSIAPKGTSMNSPNTFAPSVFNIAPKPNTSTTSSSVLEDKTSVEFVNNNQFQNPGDAQKDKLNREGEGVDNSKMFRKNQYLGDFRVNASHVRISYRDFGAIDGDLVSILINDKVVVERIFLDGDFKGIELELENGFNKIDFLALNEGQSSPNTAEFRIYDNQGLLVSSNQWNLATGFKATIILVKE